MAISTAELKAIYDAAFVSYGAEVDFKKYVLSAWTGDHPHRDGIANDYPNANVVEYDNIPTILEFPGGEIAGYLSNATGDSGTVYPTSFYKGTATMKFYVPYNTDTNGMNSWNMRISSTANRYAYGRDVLVVKYRFNFYYIGFTRLYKYDDTQMFIEMEGKLITYANWPWDFTFDQSGGPWAYEQVVFDITDYPANTAFPPL